MVVTVTVVIIVTVVAK